MEAFEKNLENERMDDFKTGFLNGGCSVLNGFEWCEKKVFLGF